MNRCISSRSRSGRTATALSVCRVHSLQSTLHRLIWDSEAISLLLGKYCACTCIIFLVRLAPQQDSRSTCSISYTSTYKTPYFIQFQVQHHHRQPFLENPEMSLRAPCTEWLLPSKYGRLQSRDVLAANNCIRSTIYFLHTDLYSQHVLYNIYFTRYHYVHTFTLL